MQVSRNDAWELKPGNIPSEPDMTEVLSAAKEQILKDNHFVLLEP